MTFIRSQAATLARRLRETRRVIQAVTGPLFYGGYPGAASLIRDEQRWRRYLLDSLIETTIARDVLLQTRVDKPAMLRRLFELACRYSGQILSYTKMLGQLQDAANSTTLAHYLDLLAGVGMVCGLQKYAGQLSGSEDPAPSFRSSTQH